MAACNWKWIWNNVYLSLYISCDKRYFNPLPVSGRHIDFSFTVLFEHADSVEISHTYHLQFQLHIFLVSHPPFWFPVERGSNFAHGDISASSVGILKNKRSNIEFALISNLRPLIQWSQSLSHFHKEIIHWKIQTATGKLKKNEGLYSFSCSSVNIMVSLVCHTYTNYCNSYIGVCSYVQANTI